MKERQPESRVLPRSWQDGTIRRLTRTFFACGALALTACSPTGFISPVLLDDEVRFDSLLVGEWESRTDPEDSTETTRFRITRDSTLTYVWDSTRTDGIAIRSVTVHTYVVDVRDDKDVHDRYEARLGAFAGLRVLEVRPVEPKGVPGYNNGLMLRLYQLVVVDRVSVDEFVLRLLDPEVLERAVRREPNPTPWLEVDEDQIVLTGDRATLRSFLLEHLRQPGVLEEPTRFVRTRAP
jgi:hypothetical protein